MKLLLIALIALLLSACASVSVEKKGAEWDISYKVLWREIEDVTAEVGDVSFHLGKARSDEPDCLLTPELCK